MTDLQPCPFCGSAVTCKFFEPDGLGDYEPEHHFDCNDCEVLVILTDVSSEEACKVYNKRTRQD